jgi:hypothetical protein
MKSACLGALMLCCAASTAAAQLTCAQRAEVVERLSGRYGEKQIATGLDDNGRLIEVFVSDGGNFTILISFAHGLSCVAAAGRDWQPVGQSARQR